MESQLSFDDYMKRNYFNSLPEFVDHLKNNFPLIGEILLFGSRCKGNYTEESDYDILVIADEEGKDEILYHQLLDKYFYYDYPIIENIPVDLGVMVDLDIETMMGNKIIWDKVVEFWEVDRDLKHLWQRGGW